MDNLPPPIYDGDFSPEQKALIAGFLLHWRQGYKNGEERISSLPAMGYQDWHRGMMLFFHYAEAVTRDLLRRVGYKVAKDQSIPEFSDEYDPFLSVVRRLDKSSYVDSPPVD